MKGTQGERRIENEGEQEEEREKENAADKLSWCAAEQDSPTWTDNYFPSGLSGGRQSFLKVYFMDCVSVSAPLLHNTWNQSFFFLSPMRCYIMLFSFSKKQS